MRNTKLIRLFILVLITLTTQGCSEKIDSSGPQPLNSQQRLWIKSNQHGELMKSILNENIESHDIRRHIYLLRAGFWECRSLLETAETAMRLMEKSTILFEEENGFTLQNQDFVNGQIKYISKDLVGAHDSFNRFLNTSGVEPELIVSTKMYLNAISEKISYSDMFNANQYDKIVDRLKEFEDELSTTTSYSHILTSNDLGESLSYPYEITTVETYKCSNGVLCEWEIQDLLSYAVARGSILFHLDKFTKLSFPTAKPKERLLYELLVALIDNMRFGEVKGLEEIISKIDHAGFGESRTFLVLFQYATGIIGALENTPNIVGSFEPLSLIVFLNHNLQSEKVGIDPTVVYETLIPVLFNSKYPTEYRDLLYVELWGYLWREDQNLLERYRDRKGLTPEIRSPEYILQLLPYRANHPLENRLGMQALKTLQSNFHYLRPLIPSYEYISITSTSVINGTTTSG